jgi:hypothetical protein
VTPQSVTVTGGVDTRGGDGGDGSFESSGALDLRIAGLTVSSHGVWDPLPCFPGGGGGGISRGGNGSRSRPPSMMRSGSYMEMASHGLQQGVAIASRITGRISFQSPSRIAALHVANG